ncbi:MAG: type II toxin-antitoxin system HicB family antitoxin [Acidobacteria bacterium]|nr:type II toxin-antitoxin system HicB family antitoxin [Acidobacteriota bacterium]
MNTKPTYALVIYWSAEDKAFIVEVPELPGGAADGATDAEAVANVEVIIARLCIFFRGEPSLPISPMEIGGWLKLNLRNAANDKRIPPMEVGG